MKLVKRSFGVGPPVSLFTLGTMRSIQSSDQMYSVVKAACSIGINHIETASSYGPSERFLGDALKRLKDKDLEPTGGWVITSKLLPGSSLVEGKRQLHQLLTNLGISKLDNLAVHGLNLPEHLEWALNGEGAKLLEWAQTEDLVGQIGFSSHGSIPLIREAIESKHFKFCSLHLHLLDPARIPIARFALESGIGTMAISPADKGGHLHTPSRTFTEDCSPVPPLELAYRFLLAKGISTLTVGAVEPRDLALAEKLLNANTPLDKQEQKALINLKMKREERLGESLCNQCRECLPCPKDIPIPELLRLRNLSIGHDLHRFAKERYNLIGRAGHWWESINANACERCGDCLPRCPYQLAIPKLLSETHQLLKEKPRRRLWG